MKNTKQAAARRRSLLADYMRLARSRWRVEGYSQSQNVAGGERRGIS